MDIDLLYSKLFMLSAVFVIGMIGSSLSNEFASATNSTAAASGGLTTEVFVDSNFDGNSTVISENMPLLEDPFQDTISSMNITNSGDQGSGYMIEICEHKSYSGDCMILGPGEHDIDTLNGLHDQISSMRFLSPQTVELKNITAGMLINGTN
jgi:hypothetical protein